MNFHFGWPQIIWLCLTCMALGINAAFHGRTKRVEQYNFISAFISAVISGAFLYWGGFFG